MDAANGAAASVGNKMGIGGICNHYGSLQVKEAEGKFFWGIDDMGHIEWEEIPQSLYKALLKFEKSRVKPSAPY